VGESDTRGNRRSYKEALVTADQKAEDDVATTGKVEHTYIRANELLRSSWIAPAVGRLNAKRLRSAGLGERDWGRDGKGEARLGRLGQSRRKGLNAKGAANEGVEEIWSWERR